MDTGEFMVAARIGQSPSEDHELDQVEAWMIAEERFSMLRHELRSRLGTLRNASHYLQQRTEKTELWNEDQRVPLFFSLMEEELKKSEDLLAKEFSGISRLPRKVEPCSLRRCADRAVRSLKASAQVELRRDPTPSSLIPLCEVEVALLVRCLLRNAVEASPRGSLVRVRTRQRADSVILEISDEGKGLSEAEEARAFQPFVGTKLGHSGVGLNVARRLCQRHGAELRFHRPPTGGLTVEVSFPRVEVEARAGATL